MNELDAPLGLDTAEHDRACNHAALAVFGLTAFAILAGGIGWYYLRGASPAEAPVAIDFTSPAAAAVSADAPVLRQEVRDEPLASAPVAIQQHSITIIDGKTGRRETILLSPDADDDDAPTGGIMPAAASMDTAPAVVR
jgi:hypothetical protein